MTGGILQLVATGIDSIFLTSNPTVTLFKTVYKRYTNFSLLNRLHKIDNCSDFNTKGQYKLKKEADCINKMYFEIDISDLKLEYQLATNQNVITLLNKYDISTTSLLNYSNNYVYNPTDYNNIIKPLIENKLLNDVAKFNKVVIDISNNNYISTQETNDYNNMVIDISDVMAKIDTIYLYYKNKITDYKDNNIDNIDNTPYNDSNIITKTDISGTILNETYASAPEDYKMYKRMMILRNIFLKRKYYNNFNIILGQIEYFCNNFVGSSENINYLNNLEEILNNILEIDNIQNLFEMNNITTYNLNNLIHTIDNIIILFSNYYNITLQLYPETLIYQVYFNYITYFKNMFNILNIINKYLINQSYLKIQRKIVIDYLFITSQLLNNEIENAYNDIINIDNPIDTNFSYITKFNWISDDINYFVNLLYNEIITYYTLTITDSYSKDYFLYNMQNNKLILNYDIQTKLFDIFKRYYYDLNNNKTSGNNTYYNNDIIVYDEMNDILYNNSLLSLTKTYSSGYSILGSTSSTNGYAVEDLIGDKIIDLSGKILYEGTENLNKINYLFDNLIKLFIIENATPNNKKFYDNSGNKIGNDIIIGTYIGQSILDYYNNKIIENQNNNLTILQNYITNIIDENKIDVSTKGQYLTDDTYLIMNKYLITNNTIISDESAFSEEFINNFLGTLKINLLQNIHILIEIILHTLISNFYHDVTYYYINGQKKPIDYFKLGYYKTFINNKSTSNKINNLKGSNIKGLNDNISSLFNIYRINDPIYPIYFARDIQSNLTQFDINNFNTFENTTVNSYLNDIDIWKKFLLNSNETKNILQNLTFDPQTGDIVNKYIYIDTLGIAYDRTLDISSNSYYINPFNNIYDKFIAVNSNNLFIKNLIILNYIPLYIIRDIGNEIYNTFENNMLANGILSDLSANQLLLFDFRDFDEREDSIFYGTGTNSCDCDCINESTLGLSEQYLILKSNQEFKMDLYKKIILNIILKQNNQATKPVSSDYVDLIFNKNYYQVADLEYFTAFANNYLSENQIGLISLMRPENLINIADVSGCTINLHNSKNNNNRNELYLPAIRAIVERYRIKYYTIINSNTFNNNITLQQNMISIVNNVLDNYFEFDNIDGLNNLNYSHGNYINNGFQFTQSYTNPNIYTSSDIYKQQNYIYSHAASSIWSYINKQLISNYNLFLNNTLISNDYYKNKLGNFMGSCYDFILSNLKLENKNSYFIKDPKDNTIYLSNTDGKIKANTAYSYDISGFNIDSFEYMSTINNNNTIELYYENTLTNVNTFPVYQTGFDFYSLGNKYTFSNKEINIIQNYDFTELTLTINKNNISTQNINPILNYNSNYTILDFAKGLLENKLYNDVKLNYNLQTNTISDINNLVIPYYSNILEIRNIVNPTELYTYEEYINYIVANINLSDCETQIFNYATGLIQKNNNNNLKSITDVISKIIPDLLNKFNENQNPFINTIYKSLVNVYDLYNPFYTDIITYYNQIILPYIKKNIFNEPNISKCFRNYTTVADIVNYIMTIIIKLSDYKYINDMLVENVDEYKILINNYLTENKTSYIKNILLISRSINFDINIYTIKPIRYFIQESFIPYFDLLSLLPTYLNLDVMFRNSDLDVLLRNMINKTPVNYSWVPELGHYLFEYIDFYLDEYLIDSYNSNLQSLYNKLYTPAEHTRGYNIMIGNIEKYTKYDSSDKSKIKLIIPIRFYFCKSVQNSIPMINLLYTDATIKFKLRNLQDLLIYDTNAIIKSKPKLICKMATEYIYLEEEERNKIAQSRMEFLIERFRYGNIFYYNLDDFRNNKILTKIKLGDPTKYILWRIKINQINTNVIESPIDNSVDLLYDNTKKLTWNQNGLKDIDGNFIDIIKYVKINFNDSVREQGKPMIFNNINCYSRYIGSLDNDEYLYSFSLYPMLQQPTGTANLSQIENLSIEHEFTQEFIHIMNTYGLQIEMEYWGLTYNIIRFISGMAAPLFYT